MLNQSNEWGVILEAPVDGSQPSLTWGTSVSPGGSVNTMGSYTQVLNGASAWTAASTDAFELEVTFQGLGASATTKEMLVTIGIDVAGGTTYTDFISHLSAGKASLITNGRTGITYRFPVRVPRGSSLAAKCQTADASLAPVFVSLRLFCNPSRPELIRYGSDVRTFGANTANSMGTAFTVGTASEGAWATITSALTEPLWYWELGYCNSDTACAVNCFALDLGIGDGTNKKRALANYKVSIGSTEEISKPAQGAACQASIGDNVYVRGQSLSAEVGDSVIVYGVGG